MVKVVEPSLHGIGLNVRKKPKRLLVEPPVLAYYADFDKPFILHTDACGNGLGAVLYQEQDGKERAIAFASRSLTKSDRNYPTHKLEFLALKWAVTDKFHQYLLNNYFTVFTDNNPLKMPSRIFVYPKIYSVIRLLKLI